STRYGDQRVVKPVAVASFVYRHHPIGERYAEWVTRFEVGLERGSEDEVIDWITAERQLLRDAAALPNGAARERRLRRLVSEVEGIHQKEEIRQFTREVV